MTVAFIRDADRLSMGLGDVSKDCLSSENTEMTISDDVGDLDLR
jgi:hypothetical protein